MKRWFSIEAKSFRFLSKDGSSLFRLEERRKKFVGYIFVSTQCSSWLVDTVKVACQVKEDLAKSFREGDKPLMVHGDANKAGRFLEVVVFAKGGRKGGLHFAGELRLLLASSEGGSEEPVIRSSPSSKSSPTKFAEVGVCPKDCTFVEVLQSSLDLALR
jgi:hypothetical protein